MNKTKVVGDLNALFKQRAEFYSYFDKNISRVGNTEVLDFNNTKDLNAEEVYKQFCHLDYATRKLLPAIYKAYKVSDSDLNRDF